MEPPGQQLPPQVSNDLLTETPPDGPPDTSPTTPAAPSNTSNLLRSWGHSIPPSPPVAALVVENSGSTGAAEAGAGLPVATAFVRDWVRTSIGGVVRGSATSGGETIPVSIRSEGGGERPQLDGAPQFYSGPTAVDHLEHDNAEYIIVGGEMIQAPTSVHEAPGREQQEMMENLVRNQLRQQDCMVRPKKMKTRIQNKITKLFNRGRGKQKKATQPPSEDVSAVESLRQINSVDTTSLEELNLTNAGSSAAAATPTAATAPAAGNTATSSEFNNTSTDPTMKPLAKNGRRISVNLFRRRAQSSEADSTELTDPPNQSRSQVDTVVEQFNSLPPRASADDLFFPQSERSLPPSAYPSSFEHPFMPRNESGLMGSSSPPPPPATVGGGRAQSVTASYLGTAEYFDPSGAGVAAASFIEPEASLSHLKKDDDDDDQYYLPMSLVAEQADLKVDKGDAPEVEDMLRRAMIETTTDLHVEYDEEEDDMMFLKQQSGGAAPKRTDEDVVNDTLKVVLVSDPSVDKTTLARWLRGKEKRRKSSTKTLKLSVENWELDTVTCRVFDVQGHSVPDAPNFGAHPGTQALFFSPNSLYLLVWDLGVQNAVLQSLRQSFADMEYDSDFEDDDDGSQELFLDFDREEAKNEADRALRADINNRVLSWFDCIAQRGPHSAILPVVLVPENMETKEVEHRRSVLQQVLEEHYKNKYDIQRDPNAPKLLMGADHMILSVNNFGNKEGIRELQTWVKAVANDETRSVFDHLSSPVPYGTILVREAIRGFSREHKFILLDHIMAELSDRSDLDMTMIIHCLHFLASIGELLYFGSFNDNDVLSRFVILSPTWLVSALSCILRNDLEHELAKERRFMNMQCIYSDQRYEEHEVVRTFGNSTSSCPLLSCTDAQMLWQSHNFMREASDQYSQLVETSTPAPTVFFFLERLLEFSGVLLPLGTSSESISPTMSEVTVYFVPSLLTQADPTNLWTYKHSEAYLTTLCHSWLFRDGVPPNLMESITVNILRDFFQFTRNFEPSSTHPPARSHSLHVGKSLGDFVDLHDEEVLGRVRILQALCFKSTIVLKVGTVFVDSSSDELRESYVDIFIAIVDQNSQNAVASDVMKPAMHRVVVSGKGPSGLEGKKLWKGGYEVALNSVRKTLSDMSNVDAQVVCPQCLINSNPRGASTWGWDSILAAARSGSPRVVCLKGHGVNSKLLCGICNEKQPPPAAIDSRLVNIQEVLPSVVLVCVWDLEQKNVIGAGSGFILDKKLGLVVTAGHVLFNNKNDSANFGKPYFGHTNARALIGVIPGDGSQASFRYYADLVALDPRNVDACILQIRSRLTNDVGIVDGFQENEQLSSFVPISDMIPEELKSLKMTKHFSLEENVRIAGYNQGGEGIFELGQHMSGSADIANGYICRIFKTGVARDDSFSSDSSSGLSDTFKPREEIVVKCSTIPGQSGGPFVNSEGKVIGILSRADEDRCYLVPATEIKPLVVKARAICANPSKGRPEPSISTI